MKAGTTRPWAGLRPLETHPESLKARLRFEPASLGVSPSVAPRKTLQAGREYSIWELIRAMIVFSDNQATQLLLGHIAPADLRAPFEALGTPAPDRAVSASWMPVHEFSAFFRVLFNASYLNIEMSEKALALLARSEFREGLVAGVEGQVPVAHKFGERALPDGTFQLHDCGIIYFPKSPYILCVMTRGRDLKQTGDALREISRAVYRGVARKNESSIVSHNRTRVHETEKLSETS